MDPLAWLFGLEHFGIKLGLDTIHTLLEALGRPERSFTSVHVAGTNGKGSVTAMVDAALQAAGYRSARYTSPHLVNLSERFVIAGRQPSMREVAIAADHLRVTVSELQQRGALTVHPTFFEVTTALGFELFRRHRVEVAVCEAGLGGRLDATNVLQPAVTAITTIGLDHQAHLGSTIEAIAGEKAGIIKPGTPVVVGRLQPAASSVILATAERVGARVVFATNRETLQRVRGMQIRLQGAHQLDNAAVAFHVLDELRAAAFAVSERSIQEGFSNVQWPGRLEWRGLPDGRQALLDAAHNRDGAAALAAYLRGAGEALPLVFGAMRDKDVDGILRELIPLVSAIICTRASNPRAATAEELAEAARGVAPHVRNVPIEACDAPAEALERAWRLSRRIVVAGSIFLLGDVIQIAWPPSED